jgi:uncharacterized protein YidB (DUF937 family)
MFDHIIREVASRFGLGDKAGPLVQMLLAYITNKDTDGISGFMAKLSTGGMGDIAKSWLGGGASAFPVSSSQIETLLGGQGDLLIGGATASSALGYLLPLVIGKLTPSGSIPTSLSSDVMAFITGGAPALTKSMTGAAGATAGAATVATSKVAGSSGYTLGSAANSGVNAASFAGGGLMKWLPWLAAGIAALFLLSYFNKGSDAAKQAADGAKNAAATASATAAADAAKAAADDRVLLEKPADTTDSALSNSEARRVEVTIRK